MTEYAAKAQKRWRWILRNEYTRQCTYESRHDPVPIRDPRNGRRRSRKGAILRYGIVMVAALAEAGTYEKRIQRAREGRLSDAKIARLSKLADRKIWRDEAKAARR